MRIRVFTAFSGYDSQCMALDRLAEKAPGFEYELIGWAEIDKYAIKAHDAIYPQWASRNYGDISLINWDEVSDFDLFTYSFPCTDISNAGKQKGLEKGSGTRSSLLWECEKAIEIKRPKYCLMENVAALVSEKFRPDYLEWERLMCRLGYTNYNKVLNAKDYGIPQNRKRIFMVSIHNADRSFYWPEPIPLDKRMKDVLEQNVDERYYLSDRMIKGFMRTSADTSHGHNFNPKDGEDVAFTIRTAPGQRVDDNFIKEWVIKYVGQMSSSQNSRVIDPSGISYAVINGHKDGGPKIIERDTPMKGNYKEPRICMMVGCDPNNPSSCVRSDHYEQFLEMGDDVSNTLTSVQNDNLVAEHTILQRPHGFNKGGKHTISPTLTGSAFQENNLVCEPSCACIKIGNIYPNLENMPNRSGGRVYSKEGCSTTTISRDFKTPKLIADTKPDECRLVGGSLDGCQDDSVFDIEGSSPTLDTNSEKRPRIQSDATSYRIRKLTQRECFRLMGVSETNIDKIQQSGVSQSQQYKMAGNSIVVDVLEHIFRKMFVEIGQESQQLSLF